MGLWKSRAHLKKTKGTSKVIPEKPKNVQSISKIECELCGGNSKPQWRQPSLWKPAQSVNGKTNPVEPQSIKNKLTPENLSELGPVGYKLEMGHGQVLLDQKTKAWVDEQNKINKEEWPRYGRLHNEGEELMYPDLQLDAGSPIKSQKEGTAATLEEEKGAPRPSHALQEFVKHIADPLVDKGWNLHLKFGKGESQGEQFVQGSSPWEPTDKTNKKEKISKPQIDKQIPLEMGTGGGGGGKKGGSGDKKPPEDKVEMENYPNEDEEDDSSSETSLELDINPQQLASIGLSRPLLRLRLTPRRRGATAAPGGGGMPPLLGGGTETVPQWEGQNGRGSNQPVEGGGGPPQPPNGGGGGISPPFLEWGRRMPQQQVDGGGAPPPGSNGGGNENGDDNGGGDRPPPPRRNGGGDGSDGGDDGDDGGDDSPPLSDQGQPWHCWNQGNRWVYVVQGPPRPSGQPGQDGRDGQDGQIPQLPRGMINVPGVAPTPLDTTGLENSFENLGRTMVDILTIQQQTNLALQDQTRRANDTQVEQTLAMHDLADMTEQRTYDSMFAAVHIYHGNDDEDFDEWADQWEALCEISSHETSVMKWWGGWVLLSKRSSGVLTQIWDGLWHVKS